MKNRCAGCRKNKYFVKNRTINAPFGNNEPLKSMDKLCFWCGWKLKRLIKKMKNGQK